MAILTWKQVSDTDVAAEAPCITGGSGVTDVGVRMYDFHNNQEALNSVPVDTRFDEQTENASAVFANKVNVEVFVPPGGATTEGDVELKVRVEVKVDGTANGDIQATLGAGTPVSNGTFTNTSYLFITLTISAADVRTYAGTTAILAIDLKLVSGTGNVYARCVSGSSRYERAA